VYTGTSRHARRRSGPAQWCVGGGVVEDAGELAGVDHAGLVDDQDDAAVECLLAAAPGALPAVKGA
jgi:hypothetical protein